MPNLSFSVNADATASQHDEGIVILHVSNGCLYTANHIGACIWRGIERRLALEEISKEISNDYQIALSAAREHTQRFVAELERRELVRREGSL